MQFRFQPKILALAACLALPACTLAQGMSSGMSSMEMPNGKMDSGKTVAPSQVFDHILSGEEGEIVPAAEAMPAEKFNFAPSASLGVSNGKAASVGKFEGVRTFSAQVKHLAMANYGMFRDFGVPGAKGQADFAKLTTRDEILQALKDSYAYAHKCIATLTPQNAFADMDGKGTTRVGLATHALAHANDHYGQMVEYLRMNGIIPPASMK